MASDSVAAVATKNEDGAMTTTTATPPSTKINNNNNNNKEEKQEPIEYNPRLMGYLCIIMFSATNFACISIIREHGSVGGVAFGVLTFLIASLVLLQDRSQKLLDYFNYTKAKDGYVEGCVLLFMVVWWIVGVAVITKPGGIAYQASNIYYSAWFTVFACVYTLNEWSDSKDILSIAEITGVSCTLKSWWIHFLSAWVVFACRYVLNSTYVDLIERCADHDTFYFHYYTLYHQYQFYWFALQIQQQLNLFHLSWKSCMHYASFVLYEYFIFLSLNTA